MSRQTRLQLRLENDEPKCANCKFWDRINLKLTALGRCSRDADEDASQQEADDPLTTDLTVCSRWEPKD